MWGDDVGKVQRIVMQSLKSLLRTIDFRMGVLTQHFLYSVNMILMAMGKEDTVQLSATKSLNNLL